MEKSWKHPYVNDAVMDTWQRIKELVKRSSEIEVEPNPRPPQRRPDTPTTEQQELLIS